jgi:hypothetical protein
MISIRLKGSRTETAQPTTVALPVRGAAFCPSMSLSMKYLSTVSSYRWKEAVMNHSSLQIVSSICIREWWRPGHFTLSGLQLGAGA